MLQTVRRTRHRVHVVIGLSAVLIGIVGSAAITQVGAVASAASDAHPASPAAGAERAAVLQDTADVEAIGRAVLEGGRRATDVASALSAASQARRTALLELARSDPQNFADLLLPDNVLSALGSISGNALEKKVVLRGTFSVWHHDDPQGHGTFTPRVVTPSGSVDLLYVDGQAPNVRPGSAVTVSAYQVDSQTAIAYASGSTTTTTSTAGGTGSTTPLGPLNVAVILGNFSNSTTTLDQTVPKAAFAGSRGADVDSWYSEVSYGKSSLNPSFFGPYTVSDTTSSGTCPNLSTAGTDLMSAASPYLTYSNYRRIILVFNCSGYGASTSVGEAQVSTPQGTITGALIDMDSSFLGDKYGYAHELSHNLGNYHASMFVCSPSSFTPPTRFGEGCVSAEYGNEFDTLGSTISQPRALPHLDPYHKNNAGWFGSGNYLTVTTPGTYTYKLLPYETPTSGLLALNIPRGTSGTAFTLEYRQPTGFDAWMAPSNTTYCSGQCTATEGPMIQLVYPTTGGGGGSDTQSIDTTPNSIQSNTFYPVSDNRDGALLPGKTFTDPEYGISVTTQTADATGVTVQVTIPTTATCTRGTPTVSLMSPSTQSAAPGQTLNYTVNVTNNDSSSCPANEFKYFGGHLLGDTSVGVEDFFTAIASPDVFSLAPGASKTVTVSLTPDATVVAGSYGFQLTSSGGIGTLSANALGTPNVSLPNVTFQVTSPTDTTPPSAPTNLAAQILGSSALTLSWSPATDDVAMAGYKVLVDNSHVYYTATTSFTAYNYSAGTAHTFSVQAFDRQDNLSPAATTSVTTPAQTDTTAPIAPGDLGSSVTDRTVTVSWEPGTDNVGLIGHVVSPFGVFVPVGTNSVTVSSLPTNTTYQVHVQAVDGAGNRSSYSANLLTATTVFAGTGAPTQPGPVYSPSATVTGGIQLTWAASTDPVGVSGYYVYRNGRRWATVSSNSYTDPASDLYPTGGGYQYSVEAYDAAGNVSPPTSVVQTVSPVAGSSDTTAPTGASLTSPGNGATVSATVSVSTSPTDDTGVTRVEFYVDGVSVAVSSTSPYAYSWSTTATFNGRHTLYARAYDGAGNYSTAGLTTVTVSNGTADTTAPSAPTGLTGSAASSTQVNLSWGTSTDNDLAGYRIYRNNTEIGVVSATSWAGSGSTWSDTGVIASTTYSYYVAAYDTAGNVSAPSNTVSVTTPAAAVTTGSISGTVTSRSTGAALANVKVTTTVNGSTQTAYTDSSGGYSFSNVPAGTYSMTFSMKGHKSQSAAASVTAGHTTMVNVSM